MRFFGAIGIFAVLFSVLAGTQAYLTRDSGGRGLGLTSTAPISASDGGYQLRLTPTFNAVFDPFGLPGPGGQDTPRLQVHLGGKVIYTRDEDWHRSVPVLVDVPLLQEGDALYLLATPSDEDIANPCGIRVEILDARERVVYERTLWTDGGERFSQTLRLRGLRLPMKTEQEPSDE